MHGGLIHVSFSELHAQISPWPFSIWVIDIIGNISPKSSTGHEFILVAIDYFTMWVEAANKNIKRILRKMLETSRDWSEKLPFALWDYYTSFAPLQEPCLIL